MKFDNPYGQKICLICCDHCSGHRESESVFQAPVIVKVLFPAPVIVKVKVFFPAPVIVKVNVFPSMFTKIGPI